ncbi:unnamed protein product, partial [Oppiella nova]
KVNQLVMSKVTILFVRYLGCDVTEALIREFFSLRNVYNLNVQRVKRIKNYAFIHFETRFDAQLAFNYISHMDLCETPLGERGQAIELMWAKPPKKCNYRDDCVTNKSLNPTAQPFHQYANHTN